MEHDGIIATLAPASRAMAADVTMRPWPYPYRAALAICSDLDETPAAGDYFELMRFLNTAESTRFGAGVGLEVGNSIYFDMAPGQFSYWNGDDASRAAVRALIRSGHVDCLHSFGDLATTRAHAGRALDELARHACELKVWVDHAVAPSNFGADIMRGSGDLKGSPAYHADLTCAFGIEYVWRGRVTSVPGQDAPRSVAAIARAAHPFRSAITAAKEGAKGALARMGSAKYAPHAANHVVWPGQLRSGQKVEEFLRSNPGWAGISVNDTADGFGDVVTDAFVRQLVAREAACVLYTHLGKTRMPDRTLTASTRRAFDRIAALFHGGRLLVTTTRRLLDWCTTRRRLVWTTRTDNDGIRIDVSTASLGSVDARRLDGLTFHVPASRRARIFVDGVEATAQRVNPPGDTGRASVSLPWPPLAFPPLRAV
jgi:hypothetical protein